MREPRPDVTTGLILSSTFLIGTLFIMLCMGDGMLP